MNELEPSTLTANQADFCTGGVCSVSPAGDLSNGDYIWFVCARNPLGSA